INSLGNIIARNAGIRLSADKIKQITYDHVSPLLAGDNDFALSGRVSKETIDYLTRQIKTVEKVVVSKVKLRPEYELLLTIPGVGIILCLTIMLETGPIDRFPHVGNYASYCRKVPTQWTSAGKGKGRGNKNNGNKYLAWAFSEAAEIGRRYEPKLKAYYDRKVARTNTALAHSALAHKLCRAAYHIMRDQVPFVVNKLFG
ncbi:MAG: IS110 family transposase, partial [Deltaproteobacteria bacterium]|nr:IS110 family transposase [Deltaproteobacteria bacterium]